MSWLHSSALYLQDIHNVVILFPCFCLNVNVSVIQVSGLDTGNDNASRKHLKQEQKLSITMTVGGKKRDQSLIFNYF